MVSSLLCPSFHQVKGLQSSNPNSSHHPGKERTADPEGEDRSWHGLGAGSESGCSPHLPQIKVVSWVKILVAQGNLGGGAVAGGEG